MNRIEAIRMRLSRALPGPWEWVDSMDVVWSLANDLPRTVFWLDRQTGYRPEDADFIAHAPDDIRYLLRKIERLQQEQARREMES